MKQISSLSPILYIFLNFTRLEEEHQQFTQGIAAVMLFLDRSCLQLSSGDTKYEARLVF